MSYSYPVIDFMSREIVGTIKRKRNICCFTTGQIRCVFLNFFYTPVNQINSVQPNYVFGRFDLFESLKKVLKPIRTVFKCNSCMSVSSPW